MTPYFESFSAFLAMGKHGFYVWSCWSLVAFSVIFGIIYSRRERQKIYKKITITHARQNNRTNAQ